MFSLIDGDPSQAHAIEQTLWCKYLVVMSWLGRGEGFPRWWPHAPIKRNLGRDCVRQQILSSSVYLFVFFAFSRMGRNLVDLCEQFQQVIIAQFVCPTSRQSPIIDTVHSHLLRQDPDHNIVNFRLSECLRDLVFYSVLLALPNGSFIQNFSFGCGFPFFHKSHYDCHGWDNFFLVHRRSK